jgi:transcriptional regulator with XRE-family HTH domain
MRSKFFQEVLNETPQEVEIFVRLYTDIVARVNKLLEEKGYTQKLLAEKLGKQPSEIHKWLSGNHNLTLKSIAKLEAELGEPLLIVPATKPVVTFSLKTKSSLQSADSSTTNQWQVINNLNLLENVG